MPPMKKVSANACVDGLLRLEGSRSGPLPGRAPSVVLSTASIATAVSAAWFAYRRVLLFWAVPTLLLFLFFAFVYASPWHEGALVVVWLGALWISFEDPNASAWIRHGVTAVAFLEQGFARPEGHDLGLLAEQRQEIFGHRRSPIIAALLL